MTAPGVEVCIERRPARRCPTCRRSWPADWDYCADCAVWLPGHEYVERLVRLVPHATRGGDPLPKGEHGDAVILVAEVRSDTEVVTPRDLARAREFFGLVEEVARAYRRAVASIPEIGLAAGWTDESRADEALRAAAEITKRIVDRRGRITLSMGIASGAAGLAAAVRLAALARPDWPLVSEPVYARTVDRFDFCGVMPVVPKAAPLPGPVFELVGVKPPTSGTHQTGPDRAPMLGRDQVIDLMDATLARVADGKTVVLHVVAEPGAGKSRLIREWLQRRPLREPWRVLRTHGVPYGEHPLRAWADLVAPVAVEPGGRPASRGVAADAVREALVRGGTRAVVVVDDLHWVDQLSIERLSELIVGPSVPTFVLYAYRPSFIERAPWGRSHRRVMLKALPPVTLHALVETLARQAGLEIPPTRRHEIVRRARGNPLYVEEAVEHLAALVAAGADHDEELPASLAALLIRRIHSTIDHALPELDRRCREQMRLARWSTFGSAADREGVLRDLRDLEERVAAWLDRFDVIDDARADEFLRGLASIDGQLALLNVFLGRQRAHRHRLSQAISRLQRRVDP